MPESVEAMVADFAGAAVELAREFGVALDFSEGSLEGVERVLGTLHDDLQGGNAAVRSLDAAPAAPSSTDIDEMCKLWGSYFGEVVRRRWGGEWSVEQYPGRGFATLTLTVGGNKLFPSMKVYRRLTQGAQENLWEFYGQVRARLEAVPGTKVQ